MGEQNGNEDPHIWLEEVLGEKQLSWVKARNKDCIDNLGDPKQTETYKRILGILDSKDKIPHAYRIGPSDYYNFWQDDEHVQGIWRKCSLNSFKSSSPEWMTVIDLDALPPPETDTAKTWVWHGSTLLDEGPELSKWDRALISLSPGGSDADTCREFDLIKQDWVSKDDGGFVMDTPAKTRINYRSRNEVLVGTDFGESSLTDSGYPRIVKSWKRGTPIEEALKVFEVEQTDISANMWAYHDRGFVHEFQLRTISFYSGKYYYRSLPVDALTARTADAEQTPFQHVPIPDDAEVGTFANLAIVTLRSDLESPPGQPEGTIFTAGSLLVLPIEELMKENWSNTLTLFVPTANRSLSSTTETKNYLILKILQDVRTSLEFWKYNASSGTWGKQENLEGMVPVGEDVSIESHCRNTETDDTVWLWRDGFLLPDTLDMASAEDCCAKKKKIKSKPDMFNATGLKVEQHFCKSLDGTAIPYFLIRREDIVYDGSNPTLLGAYGGFEVSNLPYYSAATGAGWLEHGGVKVIGNIRGGGEYGPAWHQAALKEHRHKCFEDMEAIAQDLIDSKITSREKLACIGGSNGGLLVGNLITRPIASTLFGAAVCQVPLLDMKRYSKLLAGASWMAEYGDPDKPEEWKFLRNHSPYHILRHDNLGFPEADKDETPSKNPSWTCPKTLFTTSTRDDRVHPGHARKMVASLLEEAGSEKAPTVFYWENIEGGHGGAADNSQRAVMWALTYTFLAKALGLSLSPICKK